MPFQPFTTRLFSPPLIVVANQVFEVPKAGMPPDVDAMRRLNIFQTLTVRQMVETATQ